VINIEATLVTCHSEKEGTAATYKHGFGYYPMLAWLDNTGEALAGMLRPGNATANDGADHATVIEDAPAQIPDGHRHGTPILVRADSAGGTRGFLGHLRSLRDERGLDVSFSIGSASPTPSPMRSGCCRRRPARSRSTPTRHHGRSTTPGCRSLRSPNSPACLAIR
jgi:Transposase DDE domain group 1